MNYINPETGRTVTDQDEINNPSAAPEFVKKFDNEWEAYGFAFTRPVRSVETGKIIN